MQQAAEPSRPGGTALFHEHKLPSALLKRMGSGPEVVAAGVSPPSGLSCTVQTLLSAGSTHSSVPFRGGVRLGMSKLSLPRTPQAHTSCREGQGHPCTAAGAREHPRTAPPLRLEPHISEEDTEALRVVTCLSPSIYSLPCRQRQVCATGTQWVLRKSGCEWSVGRWLRAEMVEAGLQRASGTVLGVGTYFWKHKRTVAGT